MPLLRSAEPVAASSGRASHLVAETLQAGDQRFFQRGLRIMSRYLSDRWLMTEADVLLSRPDGSVVVPADIVQRLGNGTVDRGRGALDQSSTTSVVAGLLDECGA
jgi:hypothetical protein